MPYMVKSHNRSEAELDEIKFTNVFLSQRRRDPVFKITL